MSGPASTTRPALPRGRERRVEERGDLRSEPRGDAHDGLLGGTARIFAAEALLVPTGLATAAFLSRRLGPEGYGLLTLASVLVVLVESNVAAALSRPSIKLVGDADDWRPIGTAVLRLYTIFGAARALLRRRSGTGLKARDEL